MLEDEFKIPCVRGIQVNRDAQGKKVPIGENNSLTPEQIANDRGNPTGNTLSIYIKHLPGIAVIDFDTKELENCALWELCCQRRYLRARLCGSARPCRSGSACPSASGIATSNRFFEYEGSMVTISL
jgi:hypothetical protein